MSLAHDVAQSRAENRFNVLHGGLGTDSVGYPPVDGHSRTLRRRLLAGHLGVHELLSRQVPSMVDSVRQQRPAFHVHLDPRRSGRAVPERRPSVLRRLQSVHLRVRRLLRHAVEKHLEDTGGERWGRRDLDTVGDSS